MIGTIAFLLTLAALFGGWLYARMRWRIFVKERQSRRAMIGHERAKTKSENARTISQRLHDHLPDRIVLRLMRHRPQRRGRRIRIARRGLLVGRSVRINPDQHILAVGMTGSGKSSTIRVLADWAKRRPDWVIEIWDGKFGATGAPYLPHARVYESLPEIEERLADLVGREFPARAKMAARPHRAVIIDESRIFNELSATGLRHLITVVQEGRELGVHVWAGLQDPKTSSVPSEVRDQFTCRLVHMLQTAEANHVALKELATAGYSAHKLDRAGQVLVHEKGRRHPARPLFALWLSPATLAATPGRVCLTKVPARPGVAVARSGRPPASTRENRHATATATPRTDDFAEAIERALLGGAAGPRALARTLDRNPGSVLRKLTRMTEQGVIMRTAEGTYAITDAPKEQDR
ncbi:type IV secretory system conjugative DNA transfer family protein [Streptomyces hokutonensis]|uniref:type IV secretory system conjugative DNA transfer family protein n=1 Tax=Streptomyces hokutonensis TaxID=1306990 RepID=UPI003823B51C